MGVLQPKDTVARQDAPTTDDICALVQHQMGWHNGADFEEDRCGCDQCDAERDEARKIVSSIVELSHATLKSRAEQAESEVTLLERNARSQATLLADTGRRVEELEAALQPFAAYQLTFVGFSYGVSKPDIRNSDWAAGFDGIQPEFKHFYAARAALNREAGND